MASKLLSRRSLLVGAAAAAGLGLTAAVARPRDRGEGGHDDYFARLSDALRAHRLARPTLVLDLDRVDANVATVTRGVGDRQLRLVAKSLPSQPLLEHVMLVAGVRRVMVFHEPFLTNIARARPDADLLLGKPIPIAAAATFYGRPRIDGFDPSRQVQWLIDSPERFRQYRELAEAQDLAIRINAEIDVGLHRGGFRSPEALGELVQAVDRSPRMTFGGLMGYEPHVAKAPSALGFQAREFGRVQDRYRAFRAVVEGAERADAEPLLFNAAGSPTYTLWRDVEGLANDLSVGSGLVMPTDFDLPTLVGHVPALFVATPVLKASDGLDLPLLGWAGDVQRAWNPNRARTFFVYGGYWKARPVSPPGLSTNPLFGRSTNQEMLNGSRRVELEVDDHVFFRPTQSESVMLQFGNIAVVRDGRIVDFWSPLPQAT